MYVSISYCLFSERKFCIGLTTFIIACILFLGLYFGLKYAKRENIIETSKSLKILPIRLQCLKFRTNLLLFVSKLFAKLSVQVIASCDNTVDNEMNLIYTPNYPSNYNINEKCSWTILTSIEQEQIQLHFDDHPCFSSI